MPVWTFYPAFAGTATSVVALTRIAWREHDRQSPRTLSELAAAEERVLKQFRQVLWVCGTLFAITSYGFIVPRLAHALGVVVAWSLTFAGEMMLALIPARGKTFGVHKLLAEGMGVGMLLLSYVFWQNLSAWYALLELGLAAGMTVLAVLMIIDRRRFIFYELSFIYLSHSSILVAALAVSHHV